MKTKRLESKKSGNLAILIPLSVLLVCFGCIVNVADVGTSTDRELGLQVQVDNVALPTIGEYEITSSDNSPPDHSNETPQPDSYRDAPGTNISVCVTDPSGVIASTIRLYVNDYSVFYDLAPIPNGYNVSYIHEVGFEPGVVKCRIVAEDNLTNQLDFTWNFTVLTTYEISLREGWNLISVPLVQVNTSLHEVLKDIDGKWDYIRFYDASDDTDHWKSYATFKPGNLNDLHTLDRTMAFWINITEPDVLLTVRGHKPTSTNILLYAGWNLVGFPTLDESMTVGDALWGTGADGVEVFYSLAQYWIKEVGSTHIMKPGEGYWVHVPADTNWVVDW